MNVMTKFADIARTPGDPEVLTKGPGSLGGYDHLARGLGWFSIGLGLAELLGARRIARGLGMEGREALLRAYGAREIASGIMSLSIDHEAGIAGRVLGDVVDVATLATARRGDNVKRGNVDLAIAAVVGVTILDIVCYQGLRARHDRPADGGRDYSGRSGLPRGVRASRGLARRDFETPRDMRAALPAEVAHPSAA